MSATGPDHHVMPCPNCGKPLDCSTSLGGDRHHDPGPVLPQPGDNSICLYCATFMVYVQGPNGQLSLAKVPDSQIAPEALALLEDFRAHLRAQKGFAE